MMKFKKGDVVVLSTRGKEILESPPDMLIRIALTYINKYSAEVIKVTDYYVGLKYLVNDGAKGYWLDKMPLIDPELLVLNANSNESKAKKDANKRLKETKEEVLGQLVYSVGLNIDEAANLYEKVRKFMRCKGAETTKENRIISLMLGFNNDIEEYRFTYAKKESMAFHAGWTTVEAQSRLIAEAIFLQKHPAIKGERSYAFCYNDDEWYKTSMMDIGNYGEFEVEKIVQASEIE